MSPPVTPTVRAILDSNVLIEGTWIHHNDAGIGDGCVRRDFALVSTQFVVLKRRLIMAWVPTGLSCGVPDPLAKQL